MLHAAMVTGVMIDATPTLHIMSYSILTQIDDGQIVARTSEAFALKPSKYMEIWPDHTRYDDSKVCLVPCLKLFKAASA